MRIVGRHRVPYDAVNPLCWVLLGMSGTLGRLLLLTQA